MYLEVRFFLEWFWGPWNPMWWLLIYMYFIFRVTQELQRREWMEMEMEMMMNGQEILQHFGQRLRECLLPDYCEDVLRLPAPPSDLSHFGGATTYEGTPAAFPLPNHHHHHHHHDMAASSPSFSLLSSALGSMLSGILQVPCSAFFFLCIYVCTHVWIGAYVCDLGGSDYLYILYGHVYVCACECIMHMHFCVSLSTCICSCMHTHI